LIEAVAGVMLSGLIIHLLNFFVLTRIYSKLNVHPRFALLFLFYPVMLWASRTLYASPLVLLLAFLGFYFYLDKSVNRWFLSGLFFGCAVLTRLDAVLIIPGFLIPAFFDSKKKFGLMLAGVLIWGVMLLVFNLSVYGNFLGGYGDGSGVFGSFSSEPLPNLGTLWVVPMILLLVFPLLAASPFLGKKRFWREFVCLLPYFYYCLRVTYVSSLAFNIPILLTGRLRYFIPLIGLLFVPYGQLLQSLFDWAVKE